MASLLMAFSFLVLISWPAMAEVDEPTAIYVFGDSTADVGNNNYIPGSKLKANFSPNGIDFPGGVPTGRSCNGYNFVDFLAQKMGFGVSPPPYLSIPNRTLELRGVNFASGGSGILDITGKNDALSMNTQVMQFKETTELLIKFMGKGNADLFLSKSVFILSSGNNDLFIYFNSECVHQNETQRETFFSLLASNFKYQLKVLHDLGARKFTIMGIGNIGCVPSMRSIDPRGSCNHKLNKFVQKFNQTIKRMLSGLTLVCRGMKYTFVDTFAISSHVVAKPLDYGFVENRRACCGNGRFNGESPCTPNATLCSDRQHYIFWDKAHLTQAFYNLSMNIAYDDQHSNTIPINIRKLVSF